MAQDTGKGHERQRVTQSGTQTNLAVSYPSMLHAFPL